MSPRTQIFSSVSQSTHVNAAPLHLQSRPVTRALAALGLSLPFGMGWAANIVVNSALDTTGNAAICTLRDAILSANGDAATGGCVAGGGADAITFTLPGGTVIPLENPLPVINRDVSIDGGAGIIIERSPTAASPEDFPILNANGVFVPPFAFALANVTLRDGYAPWYRNGAGLRANTLSSVTITDVTLGGSKFNIATVGGGAAITGVSGDVTLDRVVVMNNSGDEMGGGAIITNVRGTVSIRESSFSRNYSNNRGGGLVLAGSVGSVNIERSEFVDNQGQQGAAIFSSGAMPTTITSTYIANNVSSLGNGLWVSNANVVSVVQSWITDNLSFGGPSGQAFADGAAIYVDQGSGPLRIIDSTLGPGTGSALRGVDAPQVLIENSTVSGYLQGNAVSALTFSGTGPVVTQLDIRHSTITRNARGIGAVYAGHINVNLSNSIVSGNTNFDTEELGNVVSNYSLLGSAVAFTGNNNIVNNAPGLNPLSATFNPNRTVGPTSNPRTIPVHRPLQNSIAIDAGDPGFAGTPTRDQVGNARQRYGTSGTARVDMGAVETLIPLVSVSDGSAMEGTASANNVLFTVSLSDLPDAGSDVAVDYRTLNGSAIAGLDYVSRLGTLVFSHDGNVVAQMIAVPTIADNLVEPDKTFALQLNNVSNALFAPAGNNVTQLMATGTVINDDFAMLSVGNASTVEGGNAVFSVTLSNPSTDTVSVMYATAGGSATSGADFAPVSGSLTFAPGEISKTVTVPTIDDLFVEGTETFTLMLSNAASATIMTATGTGTIFDNDSANAITVVNTVPGFGTTTTVYETASNCVVTLGVQGLVGLGSGTLVLPNPIVPPGGYAMPYGMQQVELNTCTGGSVTVTTTWPGSFNSHWKWGATSAQPTPHWYSIATTPIGPNTVRFTLTDGGFGDNDLAANGRIVDPYAAAVAAEVLPVPLSGWLAWLSALLVSAAGVIGLRTARSKRE